MKLKLSMTPESRSYVVSHRIVEPRSKEITI